MARKISSRWCLIVSVKLPSLHLLSHQPLTMKQKLIPVKNDCYQWNDDSFYF